MRYYKCYLIFIFQPLLVYGFSCPFTSQFFSDEFESESEEFKRSFPTFPSTPQFHSVISQSYPSEPNFTNGIIPNELGPIVDPPIGAGCIPLETPCKDLKYRTFSGICNNLKNPTWGSANTVYGRLLPAKYRDGIYTLPTSVVNDKPLPLPRTISVNLFPELPVNDSRFTLITMSWSQLITHDMSLAMATTPPETASIRCCDENFHTIPITNPRCIPIIFPKNDDFYSQFDVTCIGLTRTITDLDTGCNPGNRSAEQLVVVSHWMDASLVYGNTKLSNYLIRENIGGRLKVEFKNNKPFPPRAFNVTDFCELKSQKEPCYQTGDRRTNQNPQIAVLQVLLLREHDRITRALEVVNPHWDDEKLHQEARRILIAEYQWISYYEFLIIILGIDNMLKFKLIYDTDGYTYDYDDSVFPNVLNEHATAAFRLFHSTIQGHFKLIEESRKVVKTENLSDYFQRPVVVEKRGNFDKLVLGLSTQSQERQDQFLTTEITHFLFKGKTPFGSDLKAVDILRGRDHALASYNYFREYCGLKKASKFEDFLDYIEEQNVEILKSLYRHPNDVDLVVGGSLEKLVPGTLTGPVFLCIMLKQFYITRVSDRYFFEAGGQTGSFTLDQLKQIRKVTLARILCDNGDDIRKMQPKAFHKISAE